MLPPKIRWYIAIALGKFVFHLDRRQRKIVERNLELCYPEMPENDRKDLSSRAFRSAALGLFIWGFGLFASDKRLLREVSWHGRQTMEEFLKSNQPVVLLSPHFFSPLIVVRTMSLITPLVVMYKPPVNPIIDLAYHCAFEGRLTPYRWVNWLFKKRGKNVVKMRSSRGSMRPFFRALDQKIPFFYLPDQNPTSKSHTVFAPFFGVPAATYTSLTRFVQFRNARVFLCFGLFVKDGKGIEIHTELLPKNFITGDLEIDAIRLNKTIERLIRSAPEQYFWLYKRFKTRPEGEPPIY